MTPKPPSIATPTAPSLSVRALVALGGPGTGWRHALRTAACVALPVVIGWALGYEALGLAASIGGFVGFYGANEIYRRRAIIIASAGATFVVATILGELGSRNPWLGVGLVAVFAAIVVLVMNSLRTGPPGAYLVMLVAATATAPHDPSVPFWQQPLLITGAVILAFLIQMSGWLFAPRRPQRRVTIGVCRMVQAYIDELGSPAEDRARFLASQSLLAAQDKIAAANDAAYLQVLRGASDLFAQTVQNPSDRAALATRATDLLTQARSLPYGWHRPASLTADPTTEPIEPPARPFSTKERIEARLRDGITAKHSAPRDTALRVLVACAAAGVVGTLLGLDHSYWVMAAAVLVLHQGAPRTAALRRGAQRVGGTLVGLGVAAIILTFAPQGLLIAVILALLQVGTELTVSRNYGLAVIFITPLALLTSYSLDPRPPLELIEARGVDTLIGVGIAVLVLLISTRREHEVRLTYFLSRTLDAVDLLFAALDATGPDARKHLSRESRRLARRLVEMQGAFDATNDDSMAGHRAVTERWSSLVAIQRLGYDVLAAAWWVDHGHQLSAQRDAELADAAWLARAAL